MAPEIPTQFRFEDLLTNTFPGFFSAITLFMLVDIWSPLNLTSWAIRDISNLIGFIGFVVLFGTILGVIIDGLRHFIIEGIIFENFSGYKKIEEYLDAFYPNEYIRYPYFFRVIGDKAIDIYEFIRKEQYRYSEFYANTFISLVPLSVIAPFYLFYVLLIPWNLSIILGLMSLVIACCCLNESYRTLKGYEKWKISLICGYLDYGYYVYLSVSPEYRVPINAPVHIEARIVDKKLICIPKEGIEIVVKTNLGKLYDEAEKGGIYTKIIIKTDREGKARAKLISDVPGTAILTASSYECLPAIASVKFVKDYKRR